MPYIEVQCECKHKNLQISLITRPNGGHFGLGEARKNTTLLAWRGFEKENS